VVAVNSTMLPIGTVAPDFTLPDGSGRVWAYAELVEGAPAIVIAFLSNHCPYVRHIARELGLVAGRFARKGVAVIGVMPNDVARYPDDAPAEMVRFARTVGWDFPYLYDESQAVALAYRAACTPDFYVFDASSRLVYRGQFDGARPSNQVPVIGGDLRAAVDAVLSGDRPAEAQVPSIGCSMKWKPGAEPEWYR
jgi:peroxiredoxin